MQNLKRAEFGLKVARIQHLLESDFLANRDALQ